MNFDSFLLMRNELLLTIIAVIVLIIEIFTDKNKKTIVIPVSLFLLAAVTAVNFMPLVSGELFGGMFKTDALRVTMKNVLNIGTLVVLIQSVTWIKKPENIDKISEYFILIFATLIGMNFMISSGDFLMFYIGLELATIPVASLAAFERYKNKSAEAGIKLILSSALSSGIMLYGISLIYGITGSIYFDNIATVFTTGNLSILAFVFFFAGMAFKISIVPFHLWAADVYEGAPVNIASYLSVVSKGAAVFIFTILLFTIFKSIIFVWANILYVTAILTITVGNLFAMRQKNLKRFLAFSSIAQAGFILLGIIGGTEIGMTSVVYFVLIYIFSNLGAFGVVSIISNVTGKENMDDYNGLYATNPRLSLAMMISLFSLAGIPPVAGFFGKFFLFTAAIETGYYILVLIALLNTIISLYYYLLIVKAMFINKNETPIAYFKSDNYSKIALGICLLGMVVVGFASGIWEYIISVSFGI